MVKESNLLFEATDVIPMFPTLVWKVQLTSELHAAMDATILAAIDSARPEAPELEPGQGWQSDHNLHEREEFQDLVACVEKVAKGALRFWKIADAVMKATTRKDLESVSGVGEVVDERRSSEGRSSTPFATVSRRSSSSNLSVNRTPLDTKQPSNVSR